MFKLDLIRLLQGRRHGYDEILFYSVLMLASTITPSLLLTIPLDDPTNGLTGRNYNYMFGWTMICGYGGLTLKQRFQFLCPDSRLTRWQWNVFAFGFFLMGPLSAVLIGHFGVFPVPFSYIVCGGLGMFTSLGLLVAFEASKSRCHLIRPLMSLIGTYATLIVHQAIGVLYTSQHKAMGGPNPWLPCCLRAPNSSYGMFK